MINKAEAVKRKAGFRAGKREGRPLFLFAAILFSFLVSLFLWSCEYNFPAEETVYDAGRLDLTSFVVVGDDYLAGFMDGALYTAGQQSSPGAILAGLLQQTGMGMFCQADILSENGLNV